MDIDINLDIRISIYTFFMYIHTIYMSMYTIYTIYLYIF